MKTKTDYVQDCPGGWYGCNPDQFGRGHVVVDPCSIVSAVAFLKSRVTILESEAKVMLDGGFLLPFVLKGGAR